VRDGRTIYRGEAAAAHLLARQKSAIAALKTAGITVKINTIVVPGIIKTISAKLLRRCKLAPTS